jgi:hypothetical protein
MVTTINNEKYTVTAEGRMILILLRVLAVSVFGFNTASIASYRIGRHAPEQVPEEGSGPVLEEHLTAIREEQAALLQEVAALREAIERITMPKRSTRRLETDQTLPASPPAPDDRLLRDTAVPAAAPDRQSPHAG